VPWTLDDAEQLNTRAPRSFFIPPAGVRHNLEPGDLVKLIFRLEREDGETGVERMWVQLVETDPYVGTLANDPHLTGVIAYGDRVAFGPEHVAAYAYPKGELGYDPTAACFVSPSLRDDDVPPQRLHVDAEGRWFAIAGPERPDHTWTLGYLTDKFPETEAVLREGADARNAFWRRVDEGYVREEP
jgi:hypothetical protein